MAAEPGLGSQGGGGEQDVIFRLEPGQGLPVVSKVLAGDARYRRDAAGPLARRIEQDSGGMCCVQVLAEHTADGRPPGGLAVEEVSLLGGVGAQQIVAGIPAGDMLGDQVGAGQFRQQAPGQCLLEAGQAGGGRRCDVGPGWMPAAGTASRPPG